jgi:hypothetical protein
MQAPMLVQRFRRSMQSSGLPPGEVHINGMGNTCLLTADSDGADARKARKLESGSASWFYRAVDLVSSWNRLLELGIHGLEGWGSGNLFLLAAAAVWRHLIKRR